MSRSPILVIFVDAFPHTLLQEGGFFISELGRSEAVRPGFGFSINVFPEMFAGRTPDDLGVLNKWRPNAKATLPGPVERLLRRGADRLTRRPQVLSRALHKVYEKLVGEGNLANIPFELMPMYERNHVPEVRYVFEEAGLTQVRHTEFSGDVHGRNRQIMQGARRAVGTDDGIFVSFGSLDHVGHRVGRSAEGFRKHAETLDGWCRELVEAFAHQHPDRYDVVICSDHGMGDVTRAVDAGLRRRFGAPHPRRYLYFLDANMLRVWTDDEAMSERIGTFLDSRSDGTLLTREQRRRHGISSPSFGKYVYVLDEGAVFWPGWYGGYFPRGMHGYMPDEVSQHAIIVHGGAGVDSHLALPEQSRDINAFLQDILDLEPERSDHA